MAAFWGVNAFFIMFSFLLVFFSLTIRLNGRASARSGADRRNFKALVMFLHLKTHFINV